MDGFGELLLQSFWNGVLVFLGAMGDAIAANPWPWLAIAVIAVLSLMLGRSRGRRRRYR